MARRRELIRPNQGDSRYIRRDEHGRFDEVEDVGRSLTRDRKRRAKSASRKGHGDMGDRE